MKEERSAIVSRIVTLLQDALPARSGMIAALNGERDGDVDLVRTLGIDSLDIVEFHMRVEEEFRIEIPEGEVRNLLTINSVADFVLRTKRAEPE